MTRRLAALILLSTMYLIQTSEVPQKISLTVVEVGDNFTFQCPIVEKEGNYIYWYKQSLGYMVQTITAELLVRTSFGEQFEDSRFTITREEAQYFLTIRNVSKEDEATYFCQHGAMMSQRFINGIFLAVNDRNQQKSVQVKQSPEAESVQPGDSVTLQCSLLSKNKETRVRCPGEHDVYWFRAGSGESHPGVIHTHRNSSDEQVDRSCIYSLSKTIRSSSDSGTYYCAVATCGEILFGEGTKVETRNVSDSGSELDPGVFVLGVLLACCVTVIVVLIFYVNRSQSCEQCKGATSDSHQLGHDKTSADQSNDLDDAALYFSTTTQGKKKTESPQDCVYSVTFYHNQQNPSL